MKTKWLVILHFSGDHRNAEFVVHAYTVGNAVERAIHIWESETGLNADLRGATVEKQSV